MRRKENHPIEKITINLYKGDFEKLRDLHPQLGSSKVIRDMVHVHIQKVEEAFAQTSAPIPISPHAKEIIS